MFPLVRRPEPWAGLRPAGRGPAPGLDAERVLGPLDDQAEQAIRKTACMQAPARSAPRIRFRIRFKTRPNPGLRASSPAPRTRSKNSALCRSFCDAPGMNRTCARGLGNLLLLAQPSALAP